MSERFFIVGAQRSGTTYLYQACAEHPQIEMAQPISPEPKFFVMDSLYQRGIDYYETEYFKEKKGAVILGEKSTSYYELEKAAQRIASHYPSAKIVFILRDPIQRAVSNYWFSVKHGFETVSVQDAFFKEDERWQNYDASRVSVSPFSYLRRGRYIEFIEMYERYFPADRIHVVIQEKLLKSNKHLANLYGFLNVDQTFLPAMLNQRVNANEARPNAPLSPELEEFMLNYFFELNSRLAGRLGLSLSEWKNSI